MNPNYELQKAHLLFIGLALLLVGGCMSYLELVYLLRGRDAQATVTKAWEIRKFGSTRCEVEYEFNEPGVGQRRGTDRCSTGWPGVMNGTVAVRYTPGKEGESRLSGNVSWIGLGLFATAIALIIRGIIVMSREMYFDKSTKKRRADRLQ